MGCGLQRLRKSEENSPGKIYSTLKRPQVQIKVGVAYTYRFVDFLLGAEALPGPSVLCLSSVRDLPGRLRELYLQGFVLAAVHPFVHPCGPEGVQRQLHRAVLIRLSDSTDKNQAQGEAQYLEADLVLSAEQFPDAELIHGYIKKVQDVAELGSFFAGFLHQPGEALCSSGQGELEDFSLSLHSSPTSVQRDWSDQSQIESPKHQSRLEEQDRKMENGTREDDGDRQPDGQETEAPKGPDTQPEARLDESGQSGSRNSTDSPSTCDNNQGKSPGRGGCQARPAKHHSRLELFALFSHMEAPASLQRYYTVKVPLRVQLCNGAISSVDANWLDHMTQHFSSGALLVDAYFQLGSDSDFPGKLVESVFVFQEGDSTKPMAYDAIVVEQWTILNNTEVKTDYIPLLQSLALYGWRLTCVLPTPIVKPNRDGSLATKQILFLQRPILVHKKKDSKKLSLRARSKSGKKSAKDAPKNKSEREGCSPATEKEMEEQETTEKVESTESGEDGERVKRKNDENRQNERAATGKHTKEEERKGGPEAETGDESAAEVETQEGKEAKPDIEMKEAALQEPTNQEPEGGVTSEGHHKEGPVNDEAGGGACEDSAASQPSREAIDPGCSASPEISA
ncbi:raftlin [Brienomyrus brachyistius]|uniref:raftlin n=1 Tax=Brienomyrus brachyistius TaxID=42636 RepID=UPI0020B31947|nr:raftlin [Brienomyrus brachyistius]XP_048849641.1 raftlin [Brienomyrus brachyistius]